MSALFPMRSSPRPIKMTDKVKQDGERWILACDGGGIRGIITLRCLEAFEAHCDASCLELFDLFAGTSTGAITAGALASGLRVSDLIALYRDRRREIFRRRFWGFLHPLVTKYKKKSLHRLLREMLGEITLEQCRKDILITATDTVRSETIYFSAFHPPDGTPHGTYRKIPLRHAIEASVSAPTYFPPHGRFIDGGVGVHNNPCYMAAVEALRYSSDKARSRPSLYDRSKIRVFSFGTGAQVASLKPGEAETKWSLGWVSYTIEEGMGQASYSQSYICQNELDAAERAVTFNRYELFLTPEILDRVNAPPGIDPDALTLDAVSEEKFVLLDRLGEMFGGHLRRKGFFMNAPQGNASGHWERLGAPPFSPDYVDQVLRDFEKMDKKLG